MVREAHLRMRHSNILETRFWTVLSQAIAMNMRSVIILSLQVRATSLRSRLTSQDSACTVHSGLAASEPVDFGEWTAKKIQSSIESAWQVILAAEPNHIIIHPIIAVQCPRKAQRAFWHLCAEVCRWQDDRGHVVTIMYPAHSGFWLCQCCCSLKWRNSMTLATFKNRGEQQHGEVSFLTNLPEGSLNRLESLDEGYDSEKTFDPRFAVLLSQCLVGDNRSDQRQSYLCEDIFEDFDEL